MDSKQLIKFQQELSVTSLNLHGKNIGLVLHGLIFYMLNVELSTELLFVILHFPKVFNTEVSQHFTQMHFITVSSGGKKSGSGWSVEVY